ncbi:MAG: hypothetical protein ACR2OB_00715 [Solirubrobacteraceae bacterium]
MRSLSTRAAGFLILIAGIWGGLIPFVGPYFHFTLGPDTSWTWTNGRLYLDVVPAIAAVLGGLLLLGAGPRLLGRFGALLALAGGIWFTVGPGISTLWHPGGVEGITHGSRGVRLLEHLTFHSGLGVLVTALAAYALPGVLLVREREYGAAAGVGIDGRSTVAGRPAGGPVAAGTARRPFLRRRAL